MTQREIHAMARKVQARNREVIAQAERASREISREVQASRRRSSEAIKVLRDAGLIRR